jgi:outer membrane protein assembly factor BamB
MSAIAQRLFTLVMLTVLSIGATLPAVAQEATPAGAMTQPPQPASGPGSDETPFPAARMQHYGEEPGGFWIWEPLADPNAATPVASGPFPVILYLSGCCGAGDYPTPQEVETWMSHIARQGYVVIAPVYNYQTVLDDITPLFQAALEELENPGHAAIDLNQFAVVAYSYGSAPAVHYASTAEEAGLPVPAALFIVAPCTANGFCIDLPVDPAFPEGMKAVVMAFELDSAVGREEPKVVYGALTSLPPEDRDFITLLADDTGEPPIHAQHWTPYDEVDAADWYGIWKVSGALLSCAFTGEHCAYALGNTPEQRFMGEWSDGTPVRELVVTDDVSAATPVASPVAIDPGALANPSLAFGNVARTGETGFAGIQGMPAIEWLAETGDVIPHAPVVSDGVIFVSTLSAIEARDHSTGDLLWTVSRPLSGSNVTLDGGVLYVGTFGEGLWALDAATGQEVWRYLFQEEDLSAQPPHNVIDATPLIVDGVLYVNGGPWGGVYAVDAATGDEIWRAEIDAGTGAQLSYADGVLFQPVERLFDGRRQRGEAPGLSGMVALDAATGQELWSFDTAEGYVAFATPVVTDGVVLLGASTPDNGSGIYFGLDAATGQELWRIDTLAMWGTSSAASGSMFFLTRGFPGGAYGVDAHSGEILWEHETGGAIVAGMLLAGGLLYVQSDDGKLAALDPTTGGEYWSMDTLSTEGAGTPSLIAIHDDMVFASGNASLMAISGDGSDALAETTGFDYPPAPELGEGHENYAAFTGTLSTTEPLSAPEGAAVASDGMLYIVDSENDRIAIFAPDGGFIEYWGEAGSGDGQFKFHDPNQGWKLGDIEFDAEGNIYVLDAGNQRIQKFDANRTLLTEWGSDSTDPGYMLFPGGFGLDKQNGRIYVADLDPEKILVYDTDGNYLETWGLGGPGDAERFADPTDVAVGSHGSVYVVEHGRAKLRVYSPDGLLMATWGGLGSETGRLTGPWGVSVDSEDNIYVADYYGNRVNVYAPDGVLAGVLGGPEGEAGHLGLPAFVAIDTGGTIYVSEEGSREISVFTVGGAPLAMASPQATPESTPEP